MNKFMTLAVVLFASVALSHCTPYGTPTVTYGKAPTGPAVQQVSISSLSNLANIESYLNGPASSLGYGSNAPGSYATAPATSIVSAPAYQSAPAYNSAPAYSSGSSSGYGSPSYTSLPAYATQLYPGQQNYNAYQSPPTYSTLAVPIAPSDAVAKLFVPQQQSYSSNSYSAPSNAYGSLNSAVQPINIGASY